MAYKTVTYALALAAMLAVPAMAQAQQANQPQTTQHPQATPAPAAATFITKADPGQYRASELVGVKIYNPQDENIGKVNELLVDKKGSIIGVVIGVGGFLGIGQKNVALPYTAISWVDTPPAPPQLDPPAAPPAGGAGPTTPMPAPAPAPQNQVQDYPYRGMLAMTKAQLQSAPDFKFASEAASQ
ncbi:PRC-barrel domain-containing protein [Labrys okinawensis]|uniref:PRC-barrel domain-containing protein n=1 Tax=Labrys okinawensis TaxID=346911 RepID=UPI0039BC4CDA